MSLQQEVSHPFNGFSDANISNRKSALPPKRKPIKSRACGIMMLKAVKYSSPKRKGWQVLRQGCLAKASR